MRRIYLLLLITSSLGYSQKASVMGYLPQGKFEYSNKLNYCELTHLLLCFANPDTNGDLIISSINEVVSDAKKSNPNIIVMISIAGGGLSKEQGEIWSKLIDTAENRPKFIAKIVDYILMNNLDGVDVDLEGKHITVGYSDFIIELKEALSIHNKLLSAALPPYIVSSNINEEALDALDWINIMAYDQKGPWNPKSPGQHSSYDFANNGISFWKGKGVTTDKLVIGVPFYGYNFIDDTTVTAFSYKYIVNQNTDNADLDKVGNAYYNGRLTIRSKVELANSKELKGMFIWQIAQDSFDEYSLLSTIHNKYTELGIETTRLCGNEKVLSIKNVKNNSNKIKVYPNPSFDFIHVKNNEYMHTYEIKNILGVKVQEGVITKVSSIDIRNLASGVYFLILGKRKSIVKFVKSKK